MLAELEAPMTVHQSIGDEPGGGGPAPTGSFASRPTFVGREDELELLVRGLDEAHDGNARLFILVGEAGIGKTRLADTFASHARATGARVMWGRCWEAGGAPEYWPWVQVLRACFRDAPTEESLGAVLDHLRPLVADPIVAPDGPLTSDPARDRFRIFDAVATILRVTAARVPIVIILDDLHAADEPSLLLLRFLVGELADARLVVVAIHREPELDTDDPRSELLSVLAREPTARRIEPPRLTESQIGEVIRATTGSVPRDEVVRSIVERTEGNPLFVSEMSRLLADGGVDDATSSIPASVKQVIGRRLERLSGEHRSTLQLAAVVGREFDADLIAELGVSPPDVLAALGDATTAAIVHEARGGVGRWRFSHALIRDVLYESLALPVRKAVHDRVGRAIERLAGDHLSELAYHAMLALPGGDSERARRFSSLAGRHASASAAHEEAVRHHANALATLERDPGADDALRCRLLIDLGAAQRRAGQADVAARTLLAAGAIAERMELSDELARAAIAYGGTMAWLRAGLDQDLVPFLERALAARTGHDDELRVRLLARLAGALRGELDVTRRTELSAEAVAIARRLGDPATLVLALVARQMAIAGPDSLAEMQRLTEEMTALAPATRDQELVADVVGWSRVSWLTTHGPPLDVMERLLARTGDVVEPLRLRAKSWYVAMMRNVLLLATGRFDGIEASIEQIHDVDDRSMAWDAEVSYRLARYALARERGGLDAVLPLLTGTADELPGYWLFDAAHVYAEAETGRIEDAKTHLDGYVRSSLGDMPRDSQWLWALVQLADAATLLSDREAAMQLLDLLLPYSSLAATAAFEVVGGPVGRAVGALADLLGQAEVAERSYRAALALTERTSWRPWEAWTRYGYATFLSRSQAATDAAHAGEQLRLAAGIARELGMPVLTRRIETVGTNVDAPTPAQVIAGTAATSNASMWREGDVWAITFEGRTFRMRNAKGLVHLAHILQVPGRVVAAIDLASVESAMAWNGPATPEPELGRVRASADHILDATARAEYRARIIELQSDIDEALSFGDAERAGRARAEVDFLGRELATAVGLGGRPRTHTTDAERARQSVAKAIKASIERIAGHHRGLADHLVHAVHTGALCSYSPDPRAPIRWLVTWDGASGQPPGIDGGPPAAEDRRAHPSRGVPDANRRGYLGQASTVSPRRR